MASHTGHRKSDLDARSGLKLSHISKERKLKFSKATFTLSITILNDNDIHASEVSLAHISISMERNFIY